MKHDDDVYPWSCDCGREEVPMQVTITKDIKAGVWNYRVWQDLGKKTVTHYKGVSNTFRSAADTCANKLDVMKAK